MPLSSWLSVVAICMLGAMSPGPSLAVVIRNTMSSSRRMGMVSGIAHCLGVGVYALLATAGLGVLITGNPVLFKVLTWGGAAYLAWLGIKALRASGTPALAAGNVVDENVSIFKAARDGFLISFLNPKIAVFFLALFSQFVTPEMGWQAKMIMAFTAVAIDGLWYCFIAAVVGHGAILPFLRRYTLWITRAAGVLLLAVALRVAFL
ncbi:MAG: lysine transporter LysE [Oceanospirillales bacterium LUC14_002_19_P2]|nr:MAG: lysine transporter LysE [Oceanospirillales bacterium LUC14_002_19_P2]